MGIVPPHDPDAVRVVLVDATGDLWECPVCHRREPIGSPCVACHDRVTESEVVRDLMRRKAEAEAQARDAVPWMPRDKPVATALRDGRLWLVAAASWMVALSIIGQWQGWWL